MKATRLIVLLLTLGGIMLTLNALNIDEMKIKLSKVDNKEAAANIITEYLPQVNTIEEWRDFQNIWLSVDAEACSDYFHKAAQREPSSPTYAYLLLRMEKDKDVQFNGALKLCKQAPDFYWAYRLITVNVSEQLLEDEKQGNSSNITAETYTVLEQGLQKYPNDPYLNMSMFHLYRLQNKDKQAEASLNRITDPNTLYANWEIIKSYIIKTGNMDLLNTLTGVMLEDAVKAGQYTVDESHALAMAQTLEVHEARGDWTIIKAIFEADSTLKDDPNCSPYYQKMLIQAKQYPALISFLDAKLEKGEIEYPDIEDAPLYQDLKEVPAWLSFQNKAQSMWKAGEGQRREQALQDRSDKVAPVWELQNVSNETVKLADLKGKVIVLDFWATWCGPCRKAMPALDNWMKTKMPAGVKVFSINVWESSPEKAKQYFSENGFAMTLLIGKDTLSKDYGFDGIPYICVIDKQGRVAYAQSGYSDSLEENLSFWTEALIKE